jgi:hypothetical protein
VELPDRDRWRASPKPLQEIGNLAGSAADRLLEEKSPEERLEYWEENLRKSIRKHGPISRQATMGHWRVAQALEQLDRFGEARVHLEGSLAAYRLNLGEEHPDTLVAEFNLARNLCLSGHAREAAPLCLHVGKARERIFGGDTKEMESVKQLARMIREALEAET